MEHPSIMEPLLPAATSPELNDLAIDLIKKASGFSGTLPKHIQQGMGDRVRSMNCYYSNLIEDHNTHPLDIERALMYQEYADDPKKRNLQKEAVAHTEVQQLIDQSLDLQAPPTSAAYIRWLHREFCTRLPGEMLRVENPDTDEFERIVPGQFRTGFVKVGHHIPPSPEAIESFLGRFDEVFSNLRSLPCIMALGAAHHRLVWIHPFFDGNGRVARLMSYASLLRAGVGNPLWSIARGLARHVDAYKQHLMAADSLRRGDYDGRGRLSEKTLTDFCIFFLKICIDQIEFMEGLLRPGTLLSRMESHIEENIRLKNLPKNSFLILREAFYKNEIPRKDVAALVDTGERTARATVSMLLHKGYLTSASHRDALRLGFPLEAMDRWFPGLYPAQTTSVGIP